MEIRPITQGDIAKSVRTMADSFLQEELYTYFLPDAQKRAQFLDKFMLFRLKFGMKYGTVLVTDDCEGVAVLLPPENKMKPSDLILLGGVSAMLKCNPEERKRIMDFNHYADQACADCIKTPYWHLSPICVSRRFQGNGYGGALLTYGLEKIVSVGTPCFLETQSVKNVSFYERDGFVTHSVSKIPGSSIPHITMVRPG